MEHRCIWELRKLRFAHSSSGETGVLQSMGLQRVRHALVTERHLGAKSNHPLLGVPPSREFPQLW